MPGRLDDLAEGVAGQVGQLVALEVGPQRRNRVEVGGIRSTTSQSLHNKVAFWPPRTRRSCLSTPISKAVSSLPTWTRKTMVARAASRSAARWVASAAPGRDRRQQDLFGVGGDVLDRPGIAVVGQQAWIDARPTIALVEAFGVAGPHQPVPDAAHPTNIMSRSLGATIASSQSTIQSCWSASTSTF
jgi:hypothetical protein